MKGGKVMEESVAKPAIVRAADGRIHPSIYSLIESLEILKYLHRIRKIAS